MEIFRMGEFGSQDGHNRPALSVREHPTEARALGLGVFPELEGHKKEKEHILKQVGIEIEYGEQIDYRENKGTYSMLGDYENA